MLDLIELLKNRLKEPLPGIDAQYEMAPTARVKLNVNELSPNSFKKSAVMLLVYKNDNKFFIPLTKRHTYDGNHSDQISLPGGKFEDNDGSLQNTALRELHEEIGINKSIEVIGRLTPLYIPVSNFYVEPYVGVFTENKINFETNPREVKELIQLDLESLKNESVIEKNGTINVNGQKLKTPYFNIEGQIIWGATAMILNEFKKLII